MTATRHFSTRAIHSGFKPSEQSSSCQVPIYQTAAFVFEDSGHAADLFSLEGMGMVYSRLTNPTVSALQARMADISGGVGAVATSSGLSANLTAFFNLLQAGDNIVASQRLYGGSMSQLSNAFRQFGWKANIVDIDDLDAVRAAIDSKTKAIFAESLANPGGSVCDISALAEIAHSNGIPLMIDNTMASPALLRPIEFGADIVVESSTKFLSGNGTSLGGIIVDSGNFNWAQNNKFPLLNGPEPTYHGRNFYKSFGNMAFTVRAIAVGLRDLGACQSPLNAFMTLTGIETLSLRMKKHSENSLELAKWLSSNKNILEVSYAGLPNYKYADRVRKYLPNGAGAVFTFRVKGGFQAAKDVVNSVKLFSHVANIGDTKSLIIHPASTTHSQITDEALGRIGIMPDMIRISVGIEDIRDIIDDLDQAIKASVNSNSKLAESA